MAAVRLGAEAIRAAVALQQEADLALQQAAESACVGVHVGDVVESDGPRWRRVRQRPSSSPGSLCEEAAPGEIVVSEIMRLLVADRGLRASNRSGRAG